MQTEELDFLYPEHLIAIERRSPSRVMFVRDAFPQELSLADVLAQIRAGDCLVVNDTRVLRRRLFSSDDLEILFLQPLDSEQKKWQVLCPSSRWKSNTEQTLPGDVTLQLAERGRPQTVIANRPLDDTYFEAYGELPLPPYIQKARGERHNRPGDLHSYQTAWAKAAGSLAAPTASLHFSEIDLQALKNRGVAVETITLHVGLGTFLPITSQYLDEHIMHSETVRIEADTWARIEACRNNGHRVWAMGTTVARSLESQALGRFHLAGGAFTGATDLFIRPGFAWKICGALLTNFHQPRSTLLALVSAFYSLETVKSSYAWAIEREFRLFSFGDLTVWLR